MQGILYREATQHDIPFLAEIRARNSGAEDSWRVRITGYLNGTHHPQQALKPRIIYIACNDETVIGFVAGHLTRRFECDGELQWIDVVEEYRRKGIASGLVNLLAKWFVQQEAYNICIDPGNEEAHLFYKKVGAEDLNKHWMFWKDVRTIL